MNTSNPNHPNIDQLVEYTSASLPLSRAVCIAAHIEHCPQCKQQVKQLTTLASQQLCSLSDSPAQPSLLNKVMSRIRQEDASDKKYEAIPQHQVRENFIPRCLSQFITDSIDTLKWVRLNSSVQLASLCTDTNGSKVALVRIKAGGKMAHHNHTSDEITVVLKGSFSDEDGVYRSGDYVFRDSKHKHKPVASKDSECICLITMDGPIQFTGFFSRLLNPFVRRSYANQQA